MVKNTLATANPILVRVVQLDFLSEAHCDYIVLLCLRDARYCIRSAEDGVHTQKLDRFF